MIDQSQFGKDHWSLLDYLGGLDVQDYVIRNFDKSRMRIKSKDGWKPYHGTILKDGNVVLDHDDIDCMGDLERSGYLVVFSVDKCEFVLTHRGEECVLKLREHKKNGGSYSEFEG